MCAPTRQYACITHVDFKRVLLLARVRAACMRLQDDFDIGAEEEASLEVKDRPEVQEKLERRIRSVEVKIINPPRPGMRQLPSHGSAVSSATAAGCPVAGMRRYADPLTAAEFPCRSGVIKLDDGPTRQQQTYAETAAAWPSHA